MALIILNIFALALFVLPFSNISIAQEINELEIIEQSNLKFKDENENLKSEINSLNNEIIGYQTEISQKQEQIKQFDIDKSELEFLRLNLEYSHKCRKSFFNVKGFSVGTEGYKKCILNKGRIND